MILQSRYIFLPRFPHRRHIITPPEHFLSRTNITMMSDDANAGEGPSNVGSGIQIKVEGGDSPTPPPWDAVEDGMEGLTPTRSHQSFIEDTADWTEDEKVGPSRLIRLLLNTRQFKPEDYVTPETSGDIVTQLKVEIKDEFEGAYGFRPERAEVLEFIDESGRSTTFSNRQGDTISLNDLSEGLEGLLHRYKLDPGTDATLLSALQLDKLSLGNIVCMSLDEAHRVSGDGFLYTEDRGNRTAREIRGGRAYSTSRSRASSGANESSGRHASRGSGGNSPAHTRSRSRSRGAPLSSAQRRAMDVILLRSMLNAIATSSKTAAGFIGIPGEERYEAEIEGMAVDLTHDLLGIFPSLHGERLAST